MYFNIKCMGKLPGPRNEFERSLVFETGEFEGPKFDCSCHINLNNLLYIVTVILVLIGSLRCLKEAKPVDMILV